MKHKIDKKIVLIVLCYRNTEDILVLLDSIKNERSEVGVVIVNSYYDDESMHCLKKIAQIYNCEYVNVDNLGYGYGNNRGIDFANQKFSYKYLCICNPDIEFIEFSSNYLKDDLVNSIIAPCIYTKTGKKQNPYYYKHIKLIDLLKYRGFKSNVIQLFYMGVIINKMISFKERLITKFRSKRPIPIYACHGSCYFIGYEALEKIGLPYNEDMFLFHEEEHLAKIASKNGITTYYEDSLVIKHFEDGSSTEIIKSNLVRKYMEQSFITFYKYWYKK
ncbi:hypothetical protein LB456_04575 [Psychroflexus sp. CAK57W]|uniref:glycosyltransferase family 2 protein n=1 Tax=Psychroflexus curvus TaxID=2873595 RepID=UPI001CC9A698|nr:hypothetical protein [Psychroflexus curvus]MBZ9786725.1 hypothetical protein [Psychroflexus curvus]